MTVTVAAFGTNLPWGESSLASIVDQIVNAVSQLPGVQLCQESRRYRTPAWPVGSGPDFINGVLSLETDRDPASILADLHAIEADLGRTRNRRWAARTCDLDLILHGDTVLPDRATLRHWMDLSDAEAQARFPDQLLLPHPRMHQRAFVLVPLCDVAPDWRHPILGRTARDLLESIPAKDRAEVELLD